jgi:hypothetical protein
VTADIDQLELEAVVPDGAADEAAWRLVFRRGNTRALWSGLVLVGGGRRSGWLDDDFPPGRSWVWTSRRDASYWLCRISAWTSPSRG